MISDIVNKIATKLCCVLDDIEDLQTLDLDCLIDDLKVRQSAEGKTLAVLFQVMLDNDCALYDLIEDLSNIVDADGNISVVGLDLKCLEPIKSSCKDCEGLSLVEILQLILNLLCDQDQSLISINETIININFRLEDLFKVTDPDNPIREEKINTCLNESPATPLLVSTHIENITDEEICAIRNIIGNYTPQDTSCFTEYYTNPDFVQNPATISDDLNNLFILRCGIRDHYEDCCYVDCSDIEVAYSYAYEQPTDSLILNFNSAAGFNLPDMFTDCGSTITLTDGKGASIVRDIVLEEGLTVNISLAALDKEYITVSIKTCFTDGTNTCNICKTLVLRDLIPPQECAICEFCVTADNGGYAQIVYDLNGKLGITQQIFNGGCLRFKVPDDVFEIRAIYYSEEGINFLPNSQYCGDVDLPEPVLTTCWQFDIPLSTANSVVVWEIVSSIPFGVSAAGVDLDVNYDDSYAFEYSRVITHLSPLGEPTSGKIYNSAATISYNPDQAEVFVKAPVITGAANITDACFDGSITIEWNTTNGNVGVQGKTSGFGTVYPIPGIVWPAAVNHDGPGGDGKNIQFKYTENDDTSVFLSIIGQPVSSPPSLVLRDPVTNTEMYIKGTLVDECPC